jgi:hypothetical protein
MKIRLGPHPDFWGILVVLAFLPGYWGLKALTPATKIHRLLVDIRQSTKTASEDADLVFATLDTYGQQMEMSLENEIGGLNKTLEELIAKQSKFAAGAAASEKTIRTLGESLAGSQHVATSYEKGSGAVEKKFDDVLGSVDHIAGLLQNAAVAPNGILVTSEASDTGSTKVVGAVRKLLQVHSKDLAAQYKDVLHTLKGDGTARFTPLLLSRTISALQFVKQNLRDRKVQALGQFEARAQKYSSDATDTNASIAEQRGVEAEKAQENEEISSNIAFTQTVLQKDLTFLRLVSDAGKAKRALVRRIHELHSKEQRTLQDLVDILSGKYTVKNEAAPAFLQTSMHARKALPISNLQMQIEEGLHNKVDLHQLLMKVKASLNPTTGVASESQNVRDIMASLQDILHDVQGEQSKADEVKRKCDNQMYRSEEEVQSLTANIALINMAQSHTDTAIRTVKQSIRGIAKKTDALAKSAEDCEHINSQALRTLKEQARDRSTILVALSRASEVAEQSDLATSPVVTLLRQLADTTKDHELQERSYREQQTALKNAILQYLHDYTQSLKDREFQYKDTLAALKLHAEEIADDEAGQKDGLVSSTELEQEDKGLCQGIIKAYDNHSKRRVELIGLLKRMIPKVPEIVNIEAEPMA